jgi:hypothetical protein
MSKTMLQAEDQKKMKKYAQNATIIYSLLFPFLLWFAGMSSMVADSPSISQPVAITFVCINLCLPLSIPFTLYFIWSRYLRKNYKSCRRCCFIPLYVFGIMQVFFIFLSFFW